MFPNLFLWRRSLFYFILFILLTSPTWYKYIQVIKQSNKEKVAYFNLILLTGKRVWRSWEIARLGWQAWSDAWLFPAGMEILSFPLSGALTAKSLLHKKMVTPATENTFLDPGK